jgi:hypothetical protein
MYARIPRPANQPATGIANWKRPKLKASLNVWAPDGLPRRSEIASETANASIASAAARASSRIGFTARSPA